MSPRAGVPGEPGDRRPADQRVGRRLAGLEGKRRRTRRWVAGSCSRTDRPRLRRRAGALDGRRARAAQRPRLGCAIRPTRTTTAGSTAPGWTGRGRPPARPGDRAGPGLLRAGDGPGQRRAPAAACLGRQPCSASPMPASSPSSASHPSGASSASTTSPPTGGRSDLHRLRAAGLATPYDALGGHVLEVGGDGVLWLPAYAAWWVVDAPQRQVP